MRCESICVNLFWRMWFVSSRRWQLRVEDILQAISAIQQRTNGLTFAAFQNNDMLVESVLYKFIVIGEASANIPEEIQSHHPEVPWRLMSDMRNIMAHEYFRVNLTIVWGTIQNNLPLLVEPLQRLLVSEAGKWLVIFPDLVFFVKILTKIIINISFNFLDRQLVVFLHFIAVEETPQWFLSIMIVRQ